MVAAGVSLAVQWAVEVAVAAVAGILWRLHSSETTGDGKAAGHLDRVDCVFVPHLIQPHQSGELTEMSSRVGGWTHPTNCHQKFDDRMDDLPGYNVGNGRNGDSSI
jgi:hypothetical protein